jgi:hypothetical protein
VQQERNEADYVTSSVQFEKRKRKEIEHVEKQKRKCQLKADRQLCFLYGRGKTIASLLLTMSFSLAILLLR